MLWRLDNDHIEEIFAEIAVEEGKIRDLRSSPVVTTTWGEEPLDAAERSQFYLASAEDAVSRSYGAITTQEREALARVALNLLNAADPSSDDHDSNSVHELWWSEDNDIELATTYGETPLDIVSGVHLGSRFMASDQKPRELSIDEILRRRAQCVSAFANLSMRYAQGLAIGSEELMTAAQAISSTDKILPIQQTLNWVKIFTAASVESGNLPPVAILTKAEQSPEELFPVARNWRKLRRPPTELAQTGYEVWVESWAETLLLSNLIPGVVVSHDDTPESNRALNAVMTESDASTATRAVIVASTADQLDEVCANAALKGGIVFPIRKSVEDLLPLVRRAIRQALNIVPDPDWSQAIWTSRARVATLYDLASMRDILRTIGNINVHTSDIEGAQRMMSAVDRTINAYGHYTTAHATTDRDVVKLPNELYEALADLADPHQAVAVLYSAIRANQLIVDLQAKPSYLRLTDNHLGGTASDPH